MKMHFTVLVEMEGTLDEAENLVEELMAPYQENNMGDCPEKYLEFEESEDFESEYKDRDDKKLSKKEYAEQQGYEIQDGKYGYLSNPGSTWDWYKIGGRWNGNIILKKGKKGIKGNAGTMGSVDNRMNRVDIAYGKDIDIDNKLKEDPKWSTYSYLDEENGWRESEGNDKAWQKFLVNRIKTSKPNTIFALVDCHV